MDTLERTHLQLPFGPKGVETLVIKEFDGLNNIELLEKIVIEYLEPFRKELQYNAHDKVFRNVLENNKEKLLQTLKSSGSGVNYSDKYGNTPVIIAAENGNLDTIKMLCTLQGASIHNKTSDGKNALYVATLNNQEDVVKWLASNGSDVNIADKEGITPLLVSSFQGNYTLAKELIDNGADVNWTDKHHRTPLMAASQEGNLEIVKLLLSKRAKVEKQTLSGKTALFYAGMKERAGIVKILLKARRQIIDKEDKNGTTVLMACCLHSKTDIVKLLCSLGADINRKDYNGKTALFAAVEAGNLEIVQYLVERGGDITIKTEEGRNILFYAVSIQHFELVKYLSSTFKNVDAEDVNGDTPLMIAAAKDDLDSTLQLIKSSADVNYQNKANGQTALMRASSMGHGRIVQTLIDYGASIDMKSMNGLTALDLAMFKHHKEIISCLINAGAKTHLSRKEKSEHVLIASSLGDILTKQLLSEGADPNFPDKKGCTPLMASAHNGHLDCVKLLVENGGNVNLRNANGVSAIAYAIAGKHINVIDYLLGVGADLMLLDNNEKTILFNCVEQCHIDMHKEVVQLGIDINHKCKGKTALMIACEKGYPEIATYLISMGASAAITSADGFKAIDYAFVNEHTRVQEILTKYLKTSSLDASLGEMLNVACSNSNVHAVKNLLRRGISVNFQDSNNNGLTPLISACRKGHYVVVQLLCSYGANVNFRTDPGDTALAFAAGGGFIEIVQYLLEKNACLNTTDSRGFTPLMCAAKNDNKDVVCCLTTNGALLNIKHATVGASALYLAATNGNTDIVAHLVELPVQVDSADNENHTPLLIACLNGYLPLAKILIEHNANINYKDFHYRSPLMAASQNGHMEVVKYLVSKGADLNIVTSTGMTARDYAKVNDHEDVGQWLENVGGKGGIGEKLRQRRNRQTSQRGDIGIAPQKESDNQEQVQAVQKKMDVLEQAQNQLVDMCEKGWGFEDAVSYTILKGADVNLANNHGYTPFLTAIENGNTKIAKWLINMGADVNVTNPDACTPLMFAVKTGELSLVKMIVEHHAKINTFDNKGNNALAYAKTGGHDSILTYLLEHTYGNNFNSMKACIHDDSVERIKMFIKQGLEVNIKDEDGSSLLAFCAKSKSANTNEIITLLCSNGADANHTDHRGDTPLLISIRASNIDAARAFISYGCNTLTQNKFGQDALLEACIQGSQDFATLILQSLPRYNKASISKAMKLVLMNCNASILEMFWNFTRNLCVKTLNENEHLFLIVENNYLDMIQWITDHGIDLDRKATKKKATLAIAASHGLTEMVEYFIKRKRKLGIIESTTAMIISLEAGNYEIFQVLWKSYCLQINQASDICFKDDDNIMIFTGQDERQNITSRRQKPVDSQEVITDFEPETILLTNQEMNAAYRLFTQIMIRESPKYIKEYSRDWHMNKIYIRTDKMNAQYAKNFIQERVQYKNPLMETVHFEYIIYDAYSAKYLMFRGSPTRVKRLLAEKPRSGSIIFETDRDIATKLMSKDINKLDIEMTIGTLACFMYRHKFENPKSCSIWGLTVGHQFNLSEMQGAAATCDTFLLSEYSELKEKAPEENVCIVADKYHATTDIFKTEDDEYYTVDVATFPLYEPTKLLNLYDINICTDKQAQDVFRGNDRFLLGRKVHKLGYMTGHTEGIIKDVNHMVSIDGCNHYGLFLVKSEKMCFASEGDSGSVVIDSENGYLLGIICGLVRYPDGDSFDEYVCCTRLDHTLQYAQDKWEVVLSFNIQSERAPRNDTMDRRSNCHCGLYDDMIRLQKDHHRERQKRMSDEAFLANLQYKTEMDKIHDEKKIKDLERENLELRGKVQILTEKLHHLQKDKSMLVCSSRSNITTKRTHPHPRR